MLEAVAILTVIAAFLSSERSQAFPTWQQTPDGRLVGYRCMRYDPKRHRAVSGADSRQWVSLTPGDVHTMSGRGFFLTNSPDHAIDYYAVHDDNVILAYAFDPADLTGGHIGGTDTEISVTRGELLGFVTGSAEEDWA